MIRAGKVNVLIDMNTAYEIAAILEEAALYLGAEKQCKAESYCNLLMESAAKLQTPYETDVNKTF